MDLLGLDPEHDPIIELAIRRIRFDTRERVLKVDWLVSWLEDTGRPRRPLSLAALAALTCVARPGYPIG